MDLEIDLFNFEEPIAETSKYVLTSPRSLKACERLGIKPVELLHKPLSEFEEEADDGHTSDKVQQKFELYERRRLRTLQQCREERERIMNDQWEDQNRSLKRRSLGDVSQFVDAHYKYNREELDDREKEDSQVSEDFSFMVENKSDRDKTQERNDQNTVQTIHGRRTLKSSIRTPSWTNERLDSPSMNNNSNHVERLMHRNDLIGCKHRNDDNNVDWYIKERTANTPQRTIKPHSQNSSTSMSTTKSSRRHRSLSIDTIVADLPSHLAKGVTKLSEQDQRLLSKMISKALDDEEDERFRSAKKLQLAEMKSLEEEMRNMKLKQKQMLIADKIRENEQKKRMMEKERENKQEKERMMHLLEIEAKNAKWLEEYSQQLDKRNANVMLRRMRDQDKRQLQKENLARAEEEQKFLRSQAHTGLIDRHEEAFKNKQLRLEMEKSKRYYKNLDERIRHKINFEETRKSLMEEQLAVQSSIENKHQKANWHLKNKEEKQQLKTSFERMKKQHRKQLQEEELTRMQADLEVWQEELKHFQNMNQDRAVESAKKTSMMKSKKVQMERLQKEYDHMLNKAKVQEDEKLRLESLNAHINYKDEKSRIIMEDKESLARASREAAQASRTIRDIIKEKTIKSSFDKMANEAERIARIEQRGLNGPKKNASSLLLG